MVWASFGVTKPKSWGLASYVCAWWLWHLNQRLLTMAQAFRKGDSSSSCLLLHLQPCFVYSIDEEFKQRDVITFWHPQAPEQEKQTSLQDDLLSHRRNRGPNMEARMAGFWLSMVEMLPRQMNIIKLFMWHMEVYKVSTRLRVTDRTDP